MIQFAGPLLRGVEGSPHPRGCACGWEPGCRQTLRGTRSEVWAYLGRPRKRPCSCVQLPGASNDNNTNQYQHIQFQAFQGLRPSQLELLALRHRGQV